MEIREDETGQKVTITMGHDDLNALVRIVTAINSASKYNTDFSSTFLKEVVAMWEKPLWN